ncbi:cofactor assembly of complex C subunit B [Cyanobium gracile]|uniref:Cofactor assembly of complex C subunit B n=1 Tax=Cyanobium gracile UHCC 0281 TaxID=3110309 RepID=A0ABU5SRD6_9CYAN|nr:cofactor assembly of complex C subunit B [Cyanobium gracile]MEA5441040.1 cofactor assembly of complex C subunit B [Cyanobium gracile UHCC 0281]
MAMPAAARVVLVCGLTGLGLVVLNQMTAPSLDPSLERASVLGSILSVLLLLVALLWQRVEPVAPERVPLQGREGLHLAPDLDAPLAEELGWGSTMLLTATPAAVVLLHWRGRVLLERGLLGSGAFQPGTICRRCTATGKAISLVDLKLYPGREEFAALPTGLPAVLVQPLGQEGVLVLGGWSPRCFSRSDLIWVDGWARRLTGELARVSAEEAPAGEVSSTAAPGTG